MIASMNTPALQSTEPSAPIAPAPVQTLAVPAEPSPSPLATGAQGATAAAAIACALAAPERTAEEAAALAEAEAMDDGSSVSLDAFKAELEGYSGKLVLRIPRSLHKHLKEEAEIEGVSLNQYMLYKLSR